MRIVDGCAGFVSKPMVGRSSGDASTGGAAVPVRKELQPFWSVVDGRVRDETTTTALLSHMVVVVCEQEIALGRESAEESPPSSAFRSQK